MPLKEVGKYTPFVMFELEIGTKAIKITII